MSENSPKIVIFDMDNTLIEINDNHNYFDQLIVDVFNHHHLKVPSRNERDKLWRYNDYKTLLSTWNFHDHRLFWETFDDLDLAGRKGLHLERKVRIYDDVKEKLRDFKSKNLKLAILTNTTLEITDFELKIFGIHEHFDYVQALGDNQDIAKPNPDGIFMILDNLFPNHKNLEKNRLNEYVFFIGDSNVDIEAGFRAGVTTIHIQRNPNKKLTLTREPDFKIKSLFELDEIIFG